MDEPTNGHSAPVITATSATDTQPQDQALAQPSQVAAVENALRSRLINLRDMPLFLRLVTLGTIGLMVLSGVLAVAHQQVGDVGVFSPLIATGDSHQPLRYSAIFIILASIIAVFGWTCALTGALHTRVIPALAGLALYTIVNAGYLLSIAWGSLSPAAMVYALFPIVPLALMWAWGVFVQRAIRQAILRGEDYPRKLMRWTFLIIFVCHMLLNGPVILADLLIYQAPVVLGSVAIDQAANIVLLAAFVLILATSDTVEGLDALVNRVGAGVQRVMGPESGIALPMLTTLVASASCLYVLKQGFDAGLSPLAVEVATLIAVTLALPAGALLGAIAWFGRGSNENTQGSVAVPVAMLLLVSVILGGVFLLLAESIGNHQMDRQPFLFPIVVSGLTPIVIACALGIPLLILGHWRGAGVKIAGVFACFLGVYGVGITLPYLVSFAGGPSPDAVFYSIPGHGDIQWAALTLNIPSIQMAAGLATLVTLIVLAVRHNLTGPNGQWLLSTLLALNCGLLALDALLDYYSHASGNTPLALTAALSVGAFLWDLLMSGQITNHGGRIFPRNQRVLLYVGYNLLIAVALALTFGAAGATIHVAETDSSSTAYTELGLTVLATPMLLTFAAWRLVTWKWGASRNPREASVRLTKA